MVADRKVRCEVVAKIEATVARELVVDGNSCVLDIIAMGIVGLSGDKHVVAHFLPIDIEFEIAQAANEDVGVTYLLVYREVFPKQGCLVVSPNPFRHPI